MSFKIITFSKEHYTRSYLNSLTEVQLVETVLADPEHTFSYDYAMVSELTSDINDNAIDVNPNHNWLFVVDK